LILIDDMMFSIATSISTGKIVNNIDYQLSRLY
jgi:hypothetical protein